LFDVTHSLLNELTKNYEYGSSRPIFFVFVLSRVVAFRKVRFRFRFFFVKIWLAKALFLTTFPVAVRLKRFDAALFVFIFGIMVPILAQ
jgi:hypothetical protein